MATTSATTAAARRRYKFASWLDRIAFAATFAGGATGIVTLKALGFSQVAVTAFPIAIMVLYLVYIFATRRYATLDEQTGDNIYYLGFLFTLVSIAYALFEFTTGGGAAERIIVNFGIALATTIFGVFFRIILMQANADPSTIERTARLELSETAIRLRSELDMAVQSLASARKATELALAEGTTGAVKSAQTALSAMTGEFKDLVDSVRTGLGTLHKESQQSLADSTATAVRGTQTALSDMTREFRKFVHSVQADLSAIHSDLGSNAIALNKSSQSVVSAAERLGQRLDAISVPSNILEEKLSGVVLGFAATANSITQVSSAAQAAVKQLEAAAASLHESLERRMDGLQQGFGTAATSLSNLSNATKTAVEGLVATSEALLQQSTQFAMSIELLRTQAERLSANDALAQQVAGQWQDLSELAERQKTALQQSSSSLLSDIQEMHRHREELRTLVTDATKMLVELENALVRLARMLVEKVNATV